MSSQAFHVMLVSPPLARIRFNLSGIMPMQPLGVAALAAYLRERGVRTSLLDSVALRHGVEDACRAVLDAQPDLVGFSTTIFNIASTHEIARRIKQQLPQTRVVLGGYGVVFPPEKLGGRLPEVDFFIKGEGEEALFQLVRALEGAASLEDVPGLIWREDGRVRSNPAGPVLDPDSLPLPALDLLPKVRYAMHPPFNIKPPLCLVETARGCGWQCNFCSLSRQLRQKSPDRVVEEVRWAKKIMRANEIHFVDPTFPARRGRFFAVTDAIARNFPKLAWTCKSRVDVIDREAAQQMARSGCYMVSLGIESGSQKMLDALNKSVTVEQTIRAVEALKGAGIRTLAYIMFGAPGETEQTVRQTMRLLRRVRPDYALFAGLMPDPLSALMAERESRGAVGQDDVFNLYYTGSAQGASLEERSFTGLPMEDLNRWVNQAFLRFYGDPRYIVERFVSARNMRDMMNLAVGAAMLARDALLTPR